MDFDRCLFLISHISVDESLAFLDLHRLIELLGHLFFRNADKGCFNLESLVWLKGDIDLFLGLGVDNPFVAVELEAFIEDLL